MPKDFSEERITETWEEEADFPLRDRFAMQFMDRWLEAFIKADSVQAPAKSADDLIAAWSIAYAYATIGIQAREPKKEKDDD